MEKKWCIWPLHCKVLNWTDEMKFGMNQFAGLIARPVDLQSRMLLLCYVVRTELKLGEGYVKCYAAPNPILLKNKLCFNQRFLLLFGKF